MPEENIRVIRHFGNENLEKLMKDIVMKKLNYYNSMRNSGSKKFDNEYYNERIAQQYGGGKNK